MPAYLEGTTLDTSSIEYSKTGIRLLKFIKTVYGNDVFEKVKKGKMIVWYNQTEVKYVWFNATEVNIMKISITIESMKTQM